MKLIARVNSSPKNLRYFQLYLWAILLFTVAVIISGDIVQATESGAGCGDSWPKCDGMLIPAFADVHMAIEFVHRMLTSVLSFGYFGLLIGGYVLFGRRHRVWPSILGSTAILVVEILLGAALVFFGWVEDNATWGRVIADSFHVVNTLALLGSLVLIIFLSRADDETLVTKQNPKRRYLIFAMLTVILITVTGTINSLADTLYFSDHVVVEETPIAQLLVSVRAIHPLVAIIGGFAIIGLLYLVLEEPSVQKSILGFAVFGVIFLQVLSGVFNIALLTPVEIQIIHLGLADALWILLVFFSLYNWKALVSNYS
jgi:cytochrome c oxidase assembly protein subunit 15